MKACVLYGPKDLRIEERPVSEPQPGFVRLRMGGVGICGSDLHYYHIGRVGNAVVREPMILGHELSGVVDAIGPGVSGLVPGQKVIINPTDECGTCGYCPVRAPEPLPGSALLRIGGPDSACTGDHGRIPDGAGPAVRGGQRRHAA